MVHAARATQWAPEMEDCGAAAYDILDDAIARLRERLLDFTRSEATHHHLDLPIEHYRQQVRQALFPDPVPPAGPELRGIR